VDVTGLPLWRIQRALAHSTSEASASNFITLAVATLDDELIGVANLAITGEASIGELGYVLARESWGHGYATEVAPSTHRLRVRRAETTPDNGDVSSR